MSRLLLLHHVPDCSFLSVQVLSSPAFLFLSFVDFLTKGLHFSPYPAGSLWLYPFVSLLLRLINFFDPFHCSLTAITESVWGKNFKILVTVSLSCKHVVCQILCLVAKTITELNVSGHLLLAFSHSDCFFLVFPRMHLLFTMYPGCFQCCVMTLWIFLREDYLEHLTAPFLRHGTTFRIAGSSEKPCSAHWHHWPYSGRSSTSPHCSLPCAFLLRSRRMGRPPSHWSWWNF